MKANIQSIIQRQSAYFNSNITKSISFRCEQLARLKLAIRAYETDIYHALNQDLRKSESEAYITEIGLCYHEISDHLSHVSKWAAPKSVPTDWRLFPLSKSMIYPEPYGNVLIISPWNYPFNLAIMPLIGAISAGNCSIIKPSEFAENTAGVIAEMIAAYFPPDYIHVVQGGVSETQQLLTENFDYIFFTGSESVGKLVMEAASKTLTPVTLELGGKCPCIVDSSAQIDICASRIVYGKFLNAGQTCIAPDYVWVHADNKSSLVEALIRKINEFWFEKLELSHNYCKIINNHHYNRLVQLLADANIIYGGHTNAANTTIAPTIIESHWDAPIMQQEIFGPFLPILTYTSLDVVIQKINSRPKPLALYLFSDQKSVHAQILEKVSSGGVCINDTLSHVANLNLPFGGVGNSGCGQYHGRYSFDTFSHQKSVFKNTVLFDFPIKYPQIKDWQLKLIKAVLR